MDRHKSYIVIDDKYIEIPKCHAEKINPKVEFLNSGQFFADRLIKSISLTDNNINEICDYGCFCCTNLSSINAPKIKVIGNWSFAYTNLKKAIFHNVDKIGDMSFYECINLSSVQFDNIKKIGKGVFNSCPNLKNIIFNCNDVVDIESDDAFEYAHQDISIFVKAEIYDRYLNSKCWTKMKHRIHKINHEYLHI